MKKSRAPIAAHEAEYQSLRERSPDALSHSEKLYLEELDRRRFARMRYAMKVRAERLAQDQKTLKQLLARRQALTNRITNLRKTHVARSQDYQIYAYSAQQAHL